MNVVVVKFADGSEETHFSSSIFNIVSKLKSDNKLSHVTAIERKVESFHSFYEVMGLDLQTFHTKIPGISGITISNCRGEAFDLYINSEGFFYVEEKK